VSVSFDKFRLRPFVQRLIDIDEVEVHDEPVSLIDLSAIIEATPKASLFRKAGPEQLELVAAVAGSRRRIAAALGVDARDVTREYLRRLETQQPVVEVPSGEAPVHEVVLTGDDVDLTKLPFFLQHELDGGPYISSAIDYTVDPATGRTNVGCRRLMLRDERSLTSNLTQESDLKRIYGGCVERKQPLPVNFAVGSHPLDFMAATLRVPSDDEFRLVGTLRGEAVPMVRGVTTGTPAPADAEMIIEGYFDAEGWRVLDGPYGEWWGFYGPTHPDPIFHVTAITMRKDVLYQSVLHGTRHLERCDAGPLADLSSEASVWRTLRAAHMEPAAVAHVTSVPSGAAVRVALKRGTPGQARAVIQELFRLPGVKHVTVVDDDIDVFSHDEVNWALTTRLRPDRDVVIESGFRTRVPRLDHTADADGTIAKMGFDATAAYDAPDDIEHWRPRPPQIAVGPARHQTVRQALRSGPKFFVQIMEAVGSTDGREVAVELERLRQQGLVDRLHNGEWHLTEGA
jgi:2,5-furandicarboxylate decarboxylase 1